VKTAAAQMANRLIKNGTTERRPNLSNGASVRALSITSSATLASKATTSTVEKMYGRSSLGLLYSLYARPAVLAHTFFTGVLRR
jgi:hypothetical protein